MSRCDDDVLLPDVLITLSLRAVQAYAPPRADVRLGAAGAASFFDWRRAAIRGSGYPPARAKRGVAKPPTSWLTVSQLARCQVARTGGPGCACATQLHVSVAACS